MSFSLPQSWSCLLKAVSVCYGGGQIMDLREMGKWKKLWGAAKLQSTRHDTSGCSRRGAVLALSSQTRPSQQPPCSPQGAGSCSLLAFPAPGKGLLWAGVSHKRHPPPPAAWHCLHKLSCGLAWGLLNRPLFMGFSSARRANHLIP